MGDDVAWVREHHRPTMRDPGCECAGWVCKYCRDTWPCEPERWVRRQGLSPIGILDYQHVT